MRLINLIINSLYRKYGDLVFKHLHTLYLMLSICLLFLNR